MESLVEMIKNLQPMQILLLLAAAVLGYPVIKKNFFDKKEPVDPKPDSDTKHELTDLVCKWECLRDACHEQGLHEACKKLNEIFPMLVTPIQDEEN